MQFDGTEQGWGVLVGRRWREEEEARELRVEEWAEERKEVKEDE